MPRPSASEAQKDLIREQAGRFIEFKTRPMKQAMIAAGLVEQTPCGLYVATRKGLRTAEVTHIDWILLQQYTLIYHALVDDDALRPVNDSAVISGKAGFYDRGPAVWYAFEKVYYNRFATDDYETVLGVAIEIARLELQLGLPLNHEQKKG